MEPQPLSRQLPAPIDTFTVPVLLFTIFLHVYASDEDEHDPAPIETDPPEAFKAIPWHALSPLQLPVQRLYETLVLQKLSH